MEIDYVSVLFSAVVGGVSGAIGAGIGMGAARVLGLSRGLGKFLTAWMALVTVVAVHFGLGFYFGSQSPEFVVEELMARDPMLAAVDQHHPEVGQSIRAVGVAMKVSDREGLAWHMRPHTNGLISRMTPQASPENTVRLMQLLRDEAEASMPFSPRACAELASGAGLVSFAPAMVGIGRYQAREDQLIIDLIDQTATSPAEAPRRLSRAEEAAFRQTVLERLPPEERDAAAEALRHPDKATRNPYADGYCRFGVAKLNALLAMPPEEAVRLYKGLHSPAT